jgi:hypothetical protein
MADESRLAVPASSAGDYAHAAARGLISLVPVAGGPLVEAFSLLISPPLEARRTEWMESVSAELDQLMQQENLTVDGLRQNDGFIDAVFQISRAAIATSDEAKRALLRNALLNTALPEAPDETLRTMYLQWVERLTTWHMRMLDFFHDPRAWYASRHRAAPEYVIVSSCSGGWGDAYPEMKSQRELNERLASDLNVAGLLSMGNFYLSMSGSGIYESRSTKFGEGLLAFVSSPLRAVPA